MILGRSHKEEGQVYPALLLAVIGTFAIAVAFLGLQNLLDQDSRADTAADSAALAVGAGFKDNLVDTLGLTDPTALLADLHSLLAGQGDWPGADAVARKYARANGADLVGTVQYEGFEMGKARWTFQVTTRQSDEVSGGGETAHSRSRSTVAIDVTGLCDGFSGVVVQGHCVDSSAWQDDCVSPTPSPTPTSSPTHGNGKGHKHSPSPSPTPTFTPSSYCHLDLAALLKFHIHLIR